MRKEYEKTFDAIEKLKEVELELHRLKNALELANKGIDAQRTWVGLTEGEVLEWRKHYKFSRALIAGVEAKLKEKNT